MIATEPRNNEYTFVGRHFELDLLERLTTGPAPSITFVHGIGGLGKSRLLDAFAQHRRAAGAVVVRIDCRDVEPTEAGFLRELSRAVGGEIVSCEGATQRLAVLGTIVLVLDDIDAARLLDAWLRRALMPALPPNVHVIFCGRRAPISAWLQMPWRGAFQLLELAPLDDSEAVALLTAYDVEAKQAARMNRVARGHPLALTLAAMTLRGTHDASLEDMAVHRIIDELAGRHLADTPDPATRRTVEAASVVRSITAPLLGAMLPDVAPSDAYERLRSLLLV